MSHAIYSPSQLDCIILCPGSVQLRRQVPKPPSSPYAQEGTLLHSYTQEELEAWPNRAGIVYEDREHEEAVQDAIQYLHGEIDFNTSGIKRFQELHVSIQDLPEVYGTLDFASITNERLDIADFKFGRGVLVNAKDNNQLLAYLAGFLDFLYINYPELYNYAQTIPWYVHIVQPRKDNHQKEEIEKYELQAFIKNTRQAIRLSKEPNPPFNFGQKQCMWCIAKPICRVYMDQHKIAQVEALRAYADIQENNVTLAEIEKVLAKKDEVMNAFKAIEQYIFLECLKGTTVKQFKLVTGRSNRVWAKGVSLDKLLERYPELEEVSDQLVEVKLKGPAQVEKLLAKDERDGLKELIVKPEGKLSLASINSPKPAVKPNDPAIAFAEFADEEGD